MIGTQAIAQKLLEKRVILAMERECKSLDDWIYQYRENLFLFYVNNSLK